MENARMTLFQVTYTLQAKTFLACKKTKRSFPYVKYVKPYFTDVTVKSSRGYFVPISRLMFYYKGDNWRILLNFMWF